MKLTVIDFIDPTSNIHLTSGYRNLESFFAGPYNESFQQTLQTLRTCYERVEQHQLDVEYLRQQFETLNATATLPTNTTATDFR